MNEKPNLAVRKATSSDMAAIHELVRELALYEKAPEQVSTTVADYEKNFADGVFDALVAEMDGKVVGMAVFYLCWSTWRGRMMYLDDFVINEAYRRYGIGQVLFDEFIKVAKEADCFLVKWQVLDWNEPALSFYRKNNAIIETDWWNGKIFLKPT